MRVMPGSKVVHADCRPIPVHAWMNPHQAVARAPTAATFSTWGRVSRETVCRTTNAQSRPSISATSTGSARPSCVACAMNT